MDKRKPKIIISVINDLVTDQRVHKVAQTLHMQGYDVLLVGRLLKESLSLSKRDYQTKRMSLIFTKGLFFYAEINIRLFLYLLFYKFDIALSNDLDTLLANFLVSKIKRKHLVYDSHEIFTEVPELINRSFQKNFWKRIEKSILPKLKYTYTVNHSVANYYNSEYGIKMQVVRNLPKSANSFSETDKISFEKRTKTIVYQGALNIGRGLKLIINAMQYLEKVQLVIIGDGDIKNELVNMVYDLKLSDKIKFLGKIPFNELKSFTVKADLGISLEDNLGLNYYFALPNKIFDYIHAGIPVLASDLPEIANLINKYKIGIVTKTRNAKELANVITHFFSNDNKYKVCKNNTLIARKELCWENEEKIIIDMFNSLKVN